MRFLSAVVREQLAPWPSVTALRLEAPGLGRVAPGQFLLLSDAARRLSVLPEIVLPWGQSDTFVEVVCSARGSPVSTPPWLGFPRPVYLLGPAGRAFTVEARTRRALLVGGGAGLGPMLFLSSQLLERGVEVTFVAARDADGPAMPASILPPEVEYILPVPDGTEDLSGALLRAVEGTLTWADALYVALPEEVLPLLVNLMRRQLLRLRKGFAQALLLPPLLPCGVGACDLCIIATRHGYRRQCRDGLVFDLLSLG